MRERCLLLGRGLLLRLRAVDDGVAGAGAACEQDGECECQAHEDDSGPGGELGELVGCAAGAKGGLRTLAAEGAGEVGGFALLQEDDADEEETDDDEDGDEEIDHGAVRDLKRSIQRVGAGRVAKDCGWCGGGDLNPYALRR